jgi:hypothetical protein
MSEEGHRQSPEQATQVISLSLFDAQNSGPENSSGGRSIDIPANGSKPHETLHYP